MHLSEDGPGRSARDLSQVCAYMTRDLIAPRSLAAVKAPVLILAGTADQLVSPLAAAYRW